MLGLRNQYSGITPGRVRDYEGCCRSNSCWSQVRHKPYSLCNRSSHDQCLVLFTVLHPPSLSLVSHYSRTGISLLHSPRAGTATSAASILGTGLCDSKQGVQEAPTACLPLSPLADWIWPHRCQHAGCPWGSSVGSTTNTVHFPWAGLSPRKQPA